MEQHETKLWLSLVGSDTFPFPNTTHLGLNSEQGLSTTSSEHLLLQSKHPGAHQNKDIPKAYCTAVESAF